jgi:hypothetical protein
MMEAGKVNRATFLRDDLIETGRVSAGQVITDLLDRIKMMESKFDTETELNRINDDKIRKLERENQLIREINQKRDS